jgi:hypothetical protein
MLHLQQRAHQNLEEFRQGSKSPPGRHGSINEPPTPVDDDDELAMLGGKTRLVKKEPASPTILERSPVSHNPVVPLPLPQSVRSDPTMAEYLDSFQHQSQPPSSTSASYSDGADTSMSPVSMYGLTTLPTSNSFHSENGPFAQHSHSMGSTQSIPTTTSTSTNGHGHHLNGGVQPPSQTHSSFPQYFPVYDYGASSMNGYPQTPMLNMDPQPPLRRSSSGSPEQNSMHSTWLNFVNNMSM